MHFVSYSLVAVHTWLLIVEPDLTYVVYQQSTGKCPYLGNTPVSLFSYVHSDICPKHTLSIPQGCSLGFDLQFHAHASLFQEFCRPPSTYVHASRAGLLPSTRRKERLALRNSYQDILDHLDFTCMYGAGLLACSPSGRGLGRRTAERAGCCPLRWGSWAAYG